LAPFITIILVALICMSIQSLRLFSRPSPMQTPMTSSLRQHVQISTFIPIRIRIPTPTIITVQHTAPLLTIIVIISLTAT
jgi:hypothetical protein